MAKPTKKTTKYALSRSKLSDRLTELKEKLDGIDTTYTSPAEVSDAIAEVSNDLADLSYEATNTSY